MKLRRIALVTVVGLGLAISSLAQQDVISTVAGGGPNGIPGVDSNIYQPYQTALDTAGNLYFTSAGQNRVYKLSTAGIVTVIAGTGTAGYSGDGGQASAAALYFPEGVAVDGASPANVYIADSNNCMVRKVSQATGVITRITGTASSNGSPLCGYTGDGGAADVAELNHPAAVAVNPKTLDVYIADYNNGRVRKVAGGSPTGEITTMAGGGGSTSTTNNCAGSAPFGDGSAATNGYLCNPDGVGLDTSVSPVNVFISEHDRCTVRDVVGANGDINLVAGSYSLGCGFKDNVVATSGQLYQPWQPAVSVAGTITTLYIGDYANGRVRKLTLTYSGGKPVPGTITTVAGSGSGGYCGDGGAALSACMNPVGVSVDGSGNLSLGDYGANRIRRVTRSTGIIATVVGWGTGNSTQISWSDPVGVTNDPATGIALYQAYPLLADPASDDLYFGGYGESATYVMDTSTGKASDFAGNGVSGFAGDGSSAHGAQTQIYLPTGFAKDTSGNIYISDGNNCAIREVFASTGVITTIAGGSEGHLNGCGFSGNAGAATSSQLYYPQGLAIDGSNNIYIAEYGYCDVRKISASTKIITTVAGVPGKCGYSGDGGAATNAEMNYPHDLSIDSAGDIYIADINNNRIRRVDAVTGVMTTVAGNGAGGFTGDGPAIGVTIYGPQGVFSDPNGNVFIADTYNQVVRWVSPTGQITTFGGTATTNGFGGDGEVATSALLAYPSRITQDSSGNFYVADYNNNRVRKINAFAGYGLSTSSLSFETQPAGTTSDFQSVKLSAIGPVAISSITVSAGFSEVDDCGGVTLSARESCEVDVYFAPGSSGTIRGTLTVNSNAYFAASGKTVSLTGVGTGLSVSGTLAYGAQLINTSVPRTLTVVNSGNAVAVQSISFSTPANFTVTGGTCPIKGGTIAAKASCTIIANFDPTTIGGKSDTLVVNSSEAASPLLMAATGTGTEVKVSASALAFGTVVDGNSSTQKVTVTNAAASGIMSISTVVSGTGFAIASGNTCTGALAAGASCAVSVTFAPTTAASYSGSLTINTNGGSSPVIALSGAGKADVAVSTASIAFGSIPDRNTSSVNLTLTNSGPHAVTLSSAFSGTNATAFAINATGNTCGTSVAAGATCTLPVKFTPTAVGSFTGTLTITTNGGSNPTVSLSGSATTDVSVSASAIAFTSITHGTNETTNLTIKNLGTSPLTVTPAISGTGAADFSINSTGDTCTAAIAGGGSCTLPVKFAPAAAASYAATLTLTTNGGSNPTVALSGAGK